MTLSGALITQKGQAAPTMPRGKDENLPAEWLTAAEAARVLGIDPATLRRWADKPGRLPGVRVYRPGKHRYFHRDDIESFKARAMSGEEAPDEKDT